MVFRPAVRTCWKATESGLRRYRHFATAEQPATDSTAQTAPKAPQIEPGNLKEFVISHYSKPKEHFDVQLSNWQRLLGKAAINLMRVDVDKTRSGPIGGYVFKNMCKEQGIYPGMLKLEKTPTTQLSTRASFYYETLGLQKTYQQWFQIDTLHIWMLYVRLRVLPRKYCREYQNKMINGIFSEIAYQLRQDVKITSDRAINNYMKQFNDQLRGAIFAYDEALTTSDATLAAALWRNLLNQDENVDFKHLEQLVHYVRTQLYVFSKVSDRDFAYGLMGFLEPWKRYEPLTEADENEIKQAAEEGRRDTHYDSNLSTEGW